MNTGNLRIRYNEGKDLTREMGSRGFPDSEKRGWYQKDEEKIL